jgi:hypothetical protein
MGLASNDTKSGMYLNHRFERAQTIALQATYVNWDIALWRLLVSTSGRFTFAANLTDDEPAS